jgi:hypothetical protein
MKLGMRYSEISAVALDISKCYAGRKYCVMSGGENNAAQQNAGA